MLETGAQVGLAFDGDGDRCIAVDELGNIIDGDKIMFILGQYLSDKGRLKQDTIVTTVMSNIGLYKAIEANNMQSVKQTLGIVTSLKKCVKKAITLVANNQDTSSSLITTIQVMGC